jgi:hypothetical protein
MRYQFFLHFFCARKCSIVIIYLGVARLTFYVFSVLLYKRHYSYCINTKSPPGRRILSSSAAGHRGLRPSPSTAPRRNPRHLYHHLAFAVAVRTSLSPSQAPGVAASPDSHEADAPRRNTRRRWWVPPLSSLPPSELFSAAAIRSRRSGTERSGVSDLIRSDGPRRRSDQIGTDQ